MNSFALVIALLSVSAFAQNARVTLEKNTDTCVIDHGPNDVVLKHGDVVIEAGQHVQNVIALDGKVTLKKGAKAKTVIVAHGDAVIEAGAEVTDSVIVLAGAIKSTGTISGAQVEVHEGAIRLTSDEGKTFKGDISFGDTSLSELIVEQALTKLGSCVVLARRP